MSTLNVTTIQSNTAATPPVINDSAGTQIGTFCRAWVNFNGTGTIAIRASFNVSSLVDNGTGSYAINFSTSITDVNYVVAAIGNGQNAFEDAGAVRTGTRATSSVALGAINGAALAYVDVSAMQVAIFR